MKFIVLSNTKMVISKELSNFDGQSNFDGISPKYSSKYER